MKEETEWRKEEIPKEQTEDVCVVSDVKVTPEKKSAADGGKYSSVGQVTSLKRHCENDDVMSVDSERIPTSSDVRPIKREPPPQTSDINGTHHLNKVRIPCKKN